jgi:putative membrane protein
LLFGLLIARLSPAVVEAEPWMFIPGGMIAITAWILPGISGSFVLLLLGLYPALLVGLTEPDFGIIGCMALGAGLGLLSFARGLQWLLTNRREAVVAGLTGIMAGSLPRLWPWRGLDGEVLLPSTYGLTTGLEPFLLSTAGLLVLGIFAVWALDRYAPEPE